jgi:hypothetical protein
VPTIESGTDRGVGFRAFRGAVCERRGSWFGDRGELPTRVFDLSCEGSLHSLMLNVGLKAERSYIYNFRIYWRGVWDEFRNR